MCCFVVIAMILDNQTTIGNQKDSIISLYTIMLLFFTSTKPPYPHKKKQFTPCLLHLRGGWVCLSLQSLICRCPNALRMQWSFQNIVLFAHQSARLPLRGISWPPDQGGDEPGQGGGGQGHGDTWQGPARSPDRRDWSWDEREWGISQWDRLWISNSSDAEIISPYWSFYGKDIIFPFCQLCIPLLPNLLQLR